MASRCPPADGEAPSQGLSARTPPATVDPNRDLARLFTSFVLAEPRPYAERARGTLGRLAALLARLGNPHLRVRAIHIAGSKGKGTTALLVESILRAGWFRIGTFMSPHLVHWTERFRIDGRPVLSSILAPIAKQT